MAFENPIEFETIKADGKHTLVYYNLMEICQGGPEVGNIKIDGKAMFLDQLFGGPSMFFDEKIYIPVFERGFLFSGFKLCIIDLTTFKRHIIGKRSSIIFIDKVQDGTIYYYKDIYKASLDCLHLPKLR